MSYTVELLNTIRNMASAEYQDRIPQATRDNVASIGMAINDTDYTTIKNEFTDLLVKIGLQLFSQKIAKNKLAKFKRGLYNGTDIEEIFVDMAKSVAFDKEGKNPLGRRKPDVKAMYHRQNYQAVYEVSVSDHQVKNAFISPNGMSQLLNSIVASLYSGANYDEYVNMKELLAKYKTDYFVYETVDPATSEATAKDFVKTVRKASNDIEFMTDLYNKAGVNTFTEKQEQVLFVHKDVVAEVDVEVLAKAFNLGKTDWETQVVVLDDFGSMTDTYALLVDSEFFMVFDTLRQQESIRNPQGLFTNYFLHVWQTQSLSKFKNAIRFAKPSA